MASNDVLSSGWFIWYITCHTNIFSLGSSHRAIGSPTNTLAPSFGRSWRPFGKARMTCEPTSKYPISSIRFTLAPARTLGRKLCTDHSPMQRSWTGPKDVAKWKIDIDSSDVCKKTSLRATSKLFENIIENYVHIYTEIWNMKHEIDQDSRIIKKYHNIHPLTSERCISDQNPPPSPPSHGHVTSEIHHWGEIRWVVTLNVSVSIKAKAPHQEKAHPFHSLWSKQWCHPQGYVRGDSPQEMLLDGPAHPTGLQTLTTWSSTNVASTHLSHMLFWKHWNHVVKSFKIEALMMKPWWIETWQKDQSPPMIKPSCWPTQA